MEYYMSVQCSTVDGATEDVRKRVKSYTPNTVWDVEVVDETLSQYTVRIDKKDENIA